MSAEFEAAAAAVKSLPKKPTNDELLEIYGLYKQATVGDNTASQPWAVQLEARAKWESHEKRKGMSKEEAMRSYVEKANALVAKYQ